MGLREASPAQKISQNILHRRHTRNDRRQQLIIGCVHFITQAMSLADHGAGASNGKKARTFARKASKTLQKAVTLAAAATAKAELSLLCGDALGGVLREAEHRAEQLAASR